MTEPVVCHKGKCRYKNARIDDRVDCSLVEEIEKDLIEQAY